jgi:hypothetical protein
MEVETKLQHPHGPLTSHFYGKLKFSSYMGITERMSEIVEKEVRSPAVMNQPRVSLAF